LAFLAINLISYLCFWLLMGLVNSQRLNEYVEYLDLLLQLPFVLNLIGLFLLIFFVAGLRGHVPPVPLGGDGIPSSAPVPLTPQERRSILQIREWTFLIEAMACNFVAVTAVWFWYNTLPPEAYLTQDFNPLVMFCYVQFVVMFLYFPIKDSFQGSSLGKWLTGLRVIDLATGRPAGFGQTFLRNWIFAIPYMALVELLCANIRADKRRLGDLMANTAVIREPAAPSRSPAD
ncbi:MAG: RDD family protein, partial [bacterium]